MLKFSFHGKMLRRAIGAFQGHFTKIMRVNFPGIERNSSKALLRSSLTLVLRVAHRIGVFMHTTVPWRISCASPRSSALGLEWGHVMWAVVGVINTPPSDSTPLTDSMSLRRHSPKAKRVGTNFFFLNRRSYKIKAVVLTKSNFVIV